MAALPNPPLLVANGDYDIPGLPRGHKYLLTAKGTWGGGTLTAKFNNGPAAAFSVVDNGELSEATATELTMTVPSDTLRLSLTGATAPSLQITLARLPQ
jgi:hypothetical protein